MLAAAVRDAGAHVVTAPMTDDDVATFRDALSRHTGDADLIITTGGVSAGAYEVVKDALGGEVDFVKVAMQPGMPQGAGSVNGTPIITLPGNPVSALVSFEVFIRAPLRTAMGLPNPDRPRRTAVLSEDLRSPDGKRQFRRGVLDRDAGTVTSYGTACVTPFALAGLGQLPAGDRRGRHRGRSPDRRCTCGTWPNPYKPDFSPVESLHDGQTPRPPRPRANHGAGAHPLYRRCTGRVCRSSG